MAESARQGEAATTTEAAPGLLDQIITNTKQTQPDRAQDLVKTLVEQALAGTVTFDRNLTRTFDKAIAAIDAKLSAQLNAIASALERMDAGTYGECTDCGQDIAPARLQATPEVARCLPCQESAERHARPAK